MTKKTSPTIACHMRPTSLYDEGFDYVLDAVQQRANVNTLFINAFGAEFPLKDIASPENLPHHGLDLKLDPHASVNQIFFAPPEDLLKDVGFGISTPSDVRYAGKEIYKDFARYRSERGIGMHARMIDPYYLKNKIQGWEKTCEVDHRGTATTSPCFRNPIYREFCGRLAEYLVGRYDLDGYHWGTERNGPLTQTLLWRGEHRAFCFCPHCVAAGKEKGIDAERARQGFAALDRAIEDTDSREPLPQTLWRLFMHYPELLAWERLWAEGREGMFGTIRDGVHAAKSEAKAGWHLWQYTASLDPFAVAATDYHALAAVSDYVKPCFYQDVADKRFANPCTPRLLDNYLRGCEPESGLRFLQNFSGYGSAVSGPLDAPSFDPVAYVSQLTGIARQKLERATNACELWVGLGIAIGGEMNASEQEIQETEDSAAAALANGADGLVFCREYQEMPFALLDAVGRGIRRSADISIPSTAGV